MLSYKVAIMEFTAISCQQIKDRGKEKGYQYNFEFLILNFELTAKKKDQGTRNKAKGSRFKVKGERKK